MFNLFTGLAGYSVNLKISYDTRLAQTPRVTKKKKKCLSIPTLLNLFFQAFNSR